MCSKVLASLIMLNACWLLSLRLAVLRVPHLKKGPAVEKRFGKATRERACYIPGDAPAPDCCQRCFLAFFGTSGSSEHMFLTSFTGAVLSMAWPKAEGQRLLLQVITHNAAIAACAAAGRWVHAVASVAE